MAKIMQSHIANYTEVSSEPKLLDSCTQVLDHSSLSYCKSEIPLCWYIQSVFKVTLDK